MITGTTLQAEWAKQIQIHAQVLLHKTAMQLARVEDAAHDPVDLQRRWTRLRRAHRTLEGIVRASVWIDLIKPNLTPDALLRLCNDPNGLDQLRFYGVEVR